MSAQRVFRVFIATPGDLDSERRVALASVEAVNVELTQVGGPIFELVGWELVRGTAQRPQEAINELVNTCDYMLCMYKKDWGSDPGGVSGFTSGTEEEFFTALLGLGKKEHPMRDVWLAFMSSNAVSTEVDELRAQIREKHAVLYEDVKDVVDLQSRLSDRLRGWARSHEKEPRVISLVPRSGRDFLGADRMRRQGEQLVDLGYPERGAELLKRAVEIGGPPERIAYARFLARQGDIDQARRVVLEAIESLVGQSPSLESPSVAEAYAYHAYLLRREGKYFEATQRLAQALGLLHSNDEYTHRVRGRILDDLGLAHHGAREYEQAIKRFEEALRIRSDQGDDYMIALSEINLARSYLSLHDVERALSLTRSAVARLEPLAPQSVHANAYLLRAQVALRLGSGSEAIDSGTKSLTLNRQLCAPRGIAMAHNVLAQAYLSVGNVAELRLHAQACVDANAQMGAKAPPYVLRMLEDAARS